MYHQITTNFDFFPFNNIRVYTKKERLLESIVNGAIMSFPIISFLLQQPQMMIISVALFGLLFVAEFFQWWIHYFFKPTEKWLLTYNRIFAQTIIILPSIKNNPIPNLEHTILHTITLINFITSLLAVLN